MSVIGGPNVIEDGLVLALDAANHKSYSGSGTEWKDLSGNGNNGELINSPTFTSDNSGSLVFDGVDNYVEMSNSFPSTSNQSISFWFKSNQFSTEQILLGEVFGTDNCITLRDNRIHKSRDNAFRTVRSNFENDVWYFATIISINNVNEIQIYVNGINEDVETNSTSNRLSTKSLIGSREISSNIELHFNGFFGLLFIHNRDITPEEVLQNYNATKGRYGL